MIKKKIRGTPKKPRLSVYRSNSAIYAQIIDDSSGNTLAHASSLELKKEAFNVDISKEVGVLLATRAIQKGVSSVIFDRATYKFHGKIKSLASGAREKGLQF